jgi:hypothetical protein
MNRPRTDTVVELLGVIVAVTDEVPRVLVVDREDGIALPTGPFLPAEHISLEDGFRRMIEVQAGLDLSYVEQLYSFGNRNRTASEQGGGPRTLSVAYIALTREHDLPRDGVRWADWYDFLPWEDWRKGRPEVIDEPIEARLDRWRKDSASEGRDLGGSERVNVTFGHEGTSEMDAVLSLERLELLYDAGLMLEAGRDHGTTSDNVGTGMADDHRRVLATALGRLRGKLAYRPVVFELLPGEFTLLQLQRVTEALSGTRLHKQNFRRLVMNANLVEPIGRATVIGRGRPAELFRFRREVLGEKLAVGLSHPTLRGD